MNLLDLSTFLLSSRNWSSSGKTFNSRVRQAIQVASTRLAADSISALEPSLEHVTVLKQITSADTGTSPRRLAATTDSWVLEFVDTTGAPYPLVVPTGSWVPATDSTWDGIYHIEIKDADGIWHRRETRTFWSVDDVNFKHYYVSLDRSFPTDSAYKEFRLYQPYIYASSRVRKMLSIDCWDELSMGLAHLVPISDVNANQLGARDYRGEQTAEYPTSYMNGPDKQIPAPNFIPLANTATPAVGWTGPYNPGVFKFKYSYVHGRRGTEWQRSPGRAIMDPLWESMPSPASAEVTNTPNPQTGAASSVIVTLPNIDFMRNFGDSSSLRYGKTGWRKRVYVAVKSIFTTTPWVNDEVETEEDVYYLLGEVDGLTTTFTWTGAVVPDYDRRLIPSPGYSAYRIWPTSIKQLELDLKVVLNPAELWSNQDALPISADAVPCFLELCLYHMSLYDGVDHNSAAIHLANYKDMLGRFVADHAATGAVIRLPVFRRNEARGLFTGTVVRG